MNEPFPAALADMFRWMTGRQNIAGAYSMHDIADAESRFGLRFPTILKEYYCTLGKDSKAEVGMHILLGLDRMSIRDGALVFCWERQHVSEYGVRCADLGLDDPPVHQIPREGGEWTEFTSRLSAFLMCNLCLGATNNFLLTSGEFPCDTLLAEAISTAFDPVPYGTADLVGAMKCFRNDSILICLFPGHDLGHYAAKSEATRDEFEAEFQAEVSDF